MKRLIGTTILGLVVTSFPCAAQISGGNPAVPAPLTDSYYNFSIVDTNNPISGTGALDYWQVYASTSGQVELLIVEPDTYDIYASNLESVTPGLNTFTLPTPISGANGDYVGFWEGNPSSVEYSINGPVPQEIGFDSLPVLFTNDNTGVPITSVGPFQGDGDRAYSIFVSSPEGGANIAYLLLAGVACFGAAVLASRKRKTVATKA